jgi:hypothetical protein
LNMRDHLDAFSDVTSRWRLSDTKQRALLFHGKAAFTIIADYLATHRSAARASVSRKGVADASERTETPILSKGGTASAPAAKSVHA